MKPITNKNIIEVISESFKTIKFKKPKELKGVKSFISYRYCKDVTCQAFTKNDDLWIKHCGWYMFHKAWIKINIMEECWNGKRL